jgi:hypothetical protein
MKTDDDDAFESGGKKFLKNRFFDEAKNPASFRFFDQKRRFSKKL